MSDEGMSRRRRYFTPKLKVPPAFDAVPHEEHARPHKNQTHPHAEIANTAPLSFKIFNGPVSFRAYLTVRGLQ